MVARGAGESQLRGELAGADTRVVRVRLPRSSRSTDRRLLLKRAGQSQDQTSTAPDAPAAGQGLLGWAGARAALSAGYPRAGDGPRARSGAWEQVGGGRGMSPISPGSTRALTAHPPELIGRPLALKISVLLRQAMDMAHPCSHRLATRAREPARRLISEETRFYKRISWPSGTVAVALMTVKPPVKVARDSARD
jgi:hypothetical protein